MSFESAGIRLVSLVPPSVVWAGKKKVNERDGNCYSYDESARIYTFYWYVETTISINNGQTTGGSYN